MSAARAMTTSEQKPVREVSRPPCGHCGDTGRRSVRGRPDGHLVSVCEACGRDVEDLGIYDEHWRAAQKALARRRERERWSSLGSAISWYVRQQERMASSRSVQDVLIERARYGCAIEGGAGSSRDRVLLDVVAIERCLPPLEDERGRVVLEAVAARALLLLTCGGARGDGLSLRDAAHLVRRAYGGEWSDKQCERLLSRVQHETRARMQERGLLPRAWAA